MKLFHFPTEDHVLASLAGQNKKYLDGSVTGLKSKAEISLKSYWNCKASECPGTALRSPSSLSQGPFPLLPCLCFGLLPRGTALERGAEEPAAG